jgi:hypothetical protein
MRGPALRFWAALLAALHSSLIAPAMNAQSTPRVAALDLVVRGLPAETGQSASDAVRRALSRSARVQLVPRPALKLRAMLLALGCARLDEACLSKIGKQLEVSMVVSGELEKTPLGLGLRLQRFDVATGRVARREERDLAGADAAAGLADAAEDLAALLAGETLQLHVESQVEGAVVLVNGQPIGTTPITVTEGLRAGTNEVLVRLRGHEDFTTKVVVRPGKPARLQATLKPALATSLPLDGDKKPPHAPPPPGPSEEAPFYKKWWFWTIVGAAVAGGTTAAVVLRRGGERAPTVGVEF